MSILRKMFFVILFLNIYELYAQKIKKTEIDLEMFVRDLFKTQESNIPYEDLYESLFQFYRQPLNVNTASADELRSLFLLNEAQIQNLLRYIEKEGKLLTMYELQRIDGFEEADIRKLLPFADLGSDETKRNNKNIFQRMKDERDNHYFLLRQKRIFEDRRGY